MLSVIGLPDLKLAWVPLSMAWQLECENGGLQNCFKLASAQVYEPLEHLNL